MCPLRSVAVVALFVALPAPALAEDFGLDLTDEVKPAPKPKPKPKAPPEAKPVPKPVPPETPAEATEAPAEATPEAKPEATEAKPEPKATDAAPPAPAPADGQGLGLDLSEEPSGPELRPVLALIGVAPPENPVAKQIERAHRTEGFLAGAVNKKDFARVIHPAEAATKLGDRAEEARGCSTAPCFAELADALDADRIVTGSLSFDPAGGYALRLVSYDRGSAAVEETKIDSPSDNGRSFDKKVAPGAVPVLEKLAARLALLKVTVTPTDATVTLNGKPLGTGSLEKPVAAGAAKLLVAATGFTPFEKDLTLSPGAKAEVSASLQPSAPVASGPRLVTDGPQGEATKVGPRSIAAKPGLWVAVGGGLAAGAGAYFGASAASVQSKAVDADRNGILDVTRSQVVTARRNATLANVLVGSGAALVAGGIIWLVLDSDGSAHGTKVEPGLPPDAVGMTLTLSGEF